MNLPMLLPRADPAVHNFTGAQAVAHLQFAQRLPLRVICHCHARYSDPDLSNCTFEREFDLGTARDLHQAVAIAQRAGAAESSVFAHDQTLLIVPEFVAIVDAEHALVLAGDICGTRMTWCRAVRSDGEARAVASQASKVRTAALAAADRRDGRLAASLLRTARSLEGRLVDPFWRALGTEVVSRPHPA